MRYRSNNIKHMTKQIFSSIRLSIIAFSILLGLNYAYAWTVPTVTPPNGNVSAPINTSDTAQTKTGALTVGAGRPVTISTTGTINIKGDTGGWANFLHFLGSSGTDRGGFGAKGSADALDYLYAGDSYTNPTMVWKGGNVGIGVTTPASKLEVAGNIRQQNGDTLQAKNSAGTAENWMWPRWSDNMMYTNFGLAGWNIRNSASSPVMFMANDGKVGIGTTAPAAALSFGNLNDGRTTADGITWYNPSPLTYGIYRTAGSWLSPDYQQLKLAWDTGVVIDGGSAYGKSGTVLQPNGGNVGIGTTAPAYKLDVTAPANNWKAIFQGTDGYIMMGPANSSWAHIYTDRPAFIFNTDIYSATGGFSSYSGDLSMKTVGTTRMTINSSTGNVGIGIATAGAKLEVAGQVKITGGTPGSGKVLTSDASGLASWTTPAGGYVDTDTLGTVVARGTITASDVTINGVNVGRGGGNVSSNTATGAGALASNTTGNANTANGNTALFANTTGYWNTANGAVSLVSNKTGNYNTANGTQALYFNYSGMYNTAIGASTLTQNNSGSYNTASGGNALWNNYASGNTATGYASLLANTGGTYNTAIGYYANVGSGYLTNATAIGNGAIVNASNKIVLGNASAATVGGYGVWSNYSDVRLKENIQYKNDLGLSFITALKTASFNYKKDVNKVRRDGLIAQDVQATLEKLGVKWSGLVVDDDEQKTLNISYESLTIPLINSVKELKAENDKLRKDNEALLSRIEKIEARLK